MAVINGKNSWYWADADLIYGGNTGDIIYLYGGDDAAYGGSAADSLYGGYGRDTLAGNDGNDRIFGDFGDDFATGGAGSDILFGNEGDDDLYGDLVYGESAFDGADSLYGGSGADRLWGSRGADLMVGGDGDDQIRLESLAHLQGDQVYGGAGTDILELNYKGFGAALTFVAADPNATKSFQGGLTVVGIERYEIRGSDQADSLTGWLHADTLMGGFGRDTIVGLDGQDKLYGGWDADTLFGGFGADQIYGDDTGYYDYYESGYGGADLIYGGFGRDFIYGGDFGDRIYGEGGADNIDGDQGNDILDGGNGADAINGDAGADTIYGGNGSDYLYSAGAFSWDTGSERDVVYGGNGSDEIWVGVGDIAGGGTRVGDVDRLVLTFSGLSNAHPHYATAVTYNLSTQGQSTVTLANGTQVAGFESLEFHGGEGGDAVTGGVLSDALYGNGGNDFLYGLAGNDVLDGGEGADRLFGGDGDDILGDGDSLQTARGDILNGDLGNDILNDGYGRDSLYGGAGDDTLNMGISYFDEDYVGDVANGGAGIDTATYRDSNTSVYIDLANQALNKGGAIGDVLTSIEIVEGSYKDDVLLGDSLANRLNGAGDDDVLDGRGGNDVLDGGSGADRLTGGAGVDHFVLESNASTFDTYFPNDVITDFVRGTDKLTVEWSEFHMNAGNFRLFNQTTYAAGGNGAAFVFETDTHRLWWDEDGRGTDSDGDGLIDENEAPILVATLNGIGALGAADFEFWNI